MKKTALAFLLASACLPALSDDALGTLTVNGRTTILKEVSASEQADPDDPAAKWLVILASDRKVAASDREPGRLLALARDGKVAAVRILWKVGFDSVRAVLYQAGCAESGLLGAERPTLDLRAYGKGKVDAEFRSKMVGQSWHFHANVKAAVVPGGTLVLEPEAPEAPEEAAGAAGGDATHAKKVTLGRLGYEFTPEMFRHAVTDGNLEAVRLFLDLKMPPDSHGKGEDAPILSAASLCGSDDASSRSAVLLALVAAGGDVKAKDENGSTALLWAAQSGCTPEAIRALLKAGADPNARAKGGATPLMFAEIFKRTEIAAILRKAGAKK